MLRAQLVFLNHLAIQNAMENTSFSGLASIWFAMHEFHFILSKLVIVVDLESRTLNYLNTDSK